MNDASLPPEHEFQAPQSNTCGPSCLAMVYKFKQKPISVQHILKDFDQSENGEATFAPQLARHLGANELETKLLVSSSQIVSPAWSNLRVNELIENLKRWLIRHPKNIWHPNNLHLLFYLQEGGQVEIVSYTVETLKRKLDAGSHLIVCVDGDWIWGHRLKRNDKEFEINEISGKITGHFVLVTGYEGDEFRLLDPLPTGLENRHGSYNVNQAQLLNASLTWDPQIIEVLK